MERPFKVLGFNKNIYYFQRLDGEIVDSQLGKGNYQVRLFHLAPLEYWRSLGHGLLSNIEKLKTECRKAGFYDAKRNE